MNELYRKFSGKTIPELFFETADRVGMRTALMVNRADGSLDAISYARLADNVRRLASFLVKAGFERNEHIALLGTNLPEWATAYLAIQAAGCVVVPLDSAQKPQELRHIIRHSDATGIFISSKFVNVLHDEEGEHLRDLAHFELEHIDALMKTEEKPLSPRMPENDKAIAAIIYTSGTTGSPKGAMLAHENIISDIAGVVPRIPFTPKDNFLSVLPVHHAFEGTAGFLTPIIMGNGICYARAMRAKEILEDIAASNATIMLGVPLLFEKFYYGIMNAIKKKDIVTKSIFGSTLELATLLDSFFKKRSGKVLMKPFRKKVGFGNMWLMISGGAAIKPEIVEFFNHFGITFVQGYGLTETSPILTVNPPEQNIAASVGPPIDGVEIKIDNPQENGVGEILARGAPIFKGYYKNEEATKEVLDKDGWFRTGDLGWIDKNGYVYITGRAKNVIVTAGGKNVYPEEIEEKLGECEFISECLVLGEKSDGDEHPFAIIVPNYDRLDEKFGGDWDEKKLEDILRKAIEEVNSKMAPYKRIKGFRIQSEEFPKTSTRKIKRYLYQTKQIEV